MYEEALSDFMLALSFCVLVLQIFVFANLKQISINFMNYLPLIGSRLRWGPPRISSLQFYRQSNVY